MKIRKSTVLTCIGAVGVIATAATAVYATPKALKLIEEAKRIKLDQSYENGKEHYDIPVLEDLEPLEIVQAAWKCYIPAVAIGFGTLFCIFGANHLSRKQQAALTSAYIFLERSYKQYKDKVKELFGEDADQKVKEAIFKDRYKNSDLPKPSEDDKLIFYEEHYGKVFERTMLEVRDAEYQLNRKLASDGEASINDFLEFLGLPDIEIGDRLGWSVQEICDFNVPSWIDFEHQLMKLDDGMECYSINMLVTPVFDYDIPF